MRIAFPIQAVTSSYSTLDQPMQSKTKMHIQDSSNTKQKSMLRRNPSTQSHGPGLRSLNDANSMLRNMREYRQSCQPIIYSLVPSGKTSSLEFDSGRVGLIGSVSQGKVRGPGDTNGGDEWLHSGRQ
jgi:hypothetical protein